MSSNSRPSPASLVGQVIQVQHGSGVRTATVNGYDEDAKLHTLTYEDTGAREAQDLRHQTYRELGASTWHRGKKKKKKGARKASSDASDWGGSYGTTSAYGNWTRTFVPYASTSSNPGCTVRFHLLLHCTALRCLHYAYALKVLLDTHEALPFRRRGYGDA